MIDSVQKIVICGDGIVANMTALALSRCLPSCFEITFISLKQSEPFDALYGNICSPLAYEFHRKLGVSEPHLLSGTDSTFSFGSHYLQWGSKNLSWVQSFQLPLLVHQGVEFHQCLLRAGITDLQPYLVSAQAALAGVFAHPPEDPKIPLSRAEYGYHVSSDHYLKILSSGLQARALQQGKSLSLKQIQSSTIRVIANEDRIDHLQLDDSQRIDADWYIDCSGPHARLISNFDNDTKSQRRVNFLSSKRPSSAKLGSAREVTGYEFGWQSDTSIRGSVSRFTLYQADDEELARQVHGVVDIAESCQLGRRDKAWLGNCIAIGHAAATIEPLTPAPLMLVQRDIERLLELIPVTQDASVERTEFNRRFALDYDHADLFNRALYQSESTPMSKFWQSVKQLPMDEKLSIKLAQFESRALITMFDLEPFNEQDWLILHFGMQRKAARYNRFAERFSSDKLTGWIDAQQRDINAIVKKMPPPDRYIARMLDYLRSRS